VREGEGVERVGELDPVGGGVDPVGIELDPVGVELDPVGVELEFEYWVPDDVDGVGEEVEDRETVGEEGADGAEPGEQAPVIEGTALAPVEIATRFVSSQSAAFARCRF